MNKFGRIFSISIFGESHGELIGVTIDGCPSGISINEQDFEHDLNRRKPAMNGSTPRKEDDLPEIVSGIYKGFSTGAPITILFRNKNISSLDYEEIAQKPRPGHADFVGYKKFEGFNDPRGGGHFSGRMTLALVAAGVVAKKIISPIEISSALMEAGGKKNIVKAIEEAVSNGDSIGGIVECSAKDVPIGLGEPFFDSFESVLSHLVFSIPAIKGIEFGSGFEAAKMKGAEHNDVFMDNSGKTLTNHSGGINGGITNGNDIVFRVVVKPTSSISKTQQTINLTNGELTQLAVQGRHDTCIALRIPVVLEASLAIVLADFKLMSY
ncbi:MAG: chorismate synthase [Bacteroidota bacterium]